MRNTSCPSIHDADVVAAWQEQMAVAVKAPDVLPHSMRDCEQLLPRVAAYYTYLKALPRRVRKALQRHWRLPLSGVALMLALGQTPILAATIPVSASCTLVNAITAANSDSATGGCPAGSGTDTIVLPPGSTQTLTTVNNSTYGSSGLPVITSAITIEGQGSTITREGAAPEFRILAVGSTGELTLQETTVSGGIAFVGGGIFSNGVLNVMHSTMSGNFANAGGGVFNSDTLTMANSLVSGNSVYGYGGGVATFNGSATITNSTILGNSAVGSYYTYTAGGGVSNFNGTLTVMNSTISANSAVYNSFGGGLGNDSATLTIINSTISGNFGGGIVNYFSGLGDNFGRITITNSTISHNSAYFRGGGVLNLVGTLTLTDTLVSGNIASVGEEIANYGSVVANKHNLFGFNGNAGVVGFSPGATDIVPPAGVQLSNILNPVLGFNGGPTQTHALVPGSPAIDAGGPVCTDANGNPLLTDQRGKPRIVDGNGDGTSRCDIGGFEFFPVVNNLVTLDPGLNTAFSPTPVPNAPAGTFTIGATFTNTSNRTLRFPFFTVTELSGDNLLLNAEEGPQGVGATVTPNVGDQVLSPGETVQVDFVVGLQTSTPFTFLVDLFAEPLVSGAATSRHRPTAATKRDRR